MEFYGFTIEWRKRQTLLSMSFMRQDCTKADLAFFFQKGKARLYRCIRTTKQTMTPRQEMYDEAMAYCGTNGDLKAYR